MKIQSQLLTSLAALAWLAAAPAIYAQTADAFDPDANGSVWCAVPQFDGRILLGGSFSTLAGESHLRVGRVETNGTPDGSFLAGADGPYPDVYSLAVQADGKVLVVGGFTNLNGQVRSHVGRLNSDGSLDTGFNPGTHHSVYFNPGVYGLVALPDGKIMVSGEFTELAGLACTNLGRLNADGTLDTNFQARAPILGGSHWAIQPDGKILVGSPLTNLAGVVDNTLFRLDANGYLDTSFVAPTSSLANCIAVQADGKILVGGGWNLFENVGGGSLGRLNPDGSVDDSFIFPQTSPYGYIYGLAVQADGKIIVGGGFTSLAGNACTNLGRFNPDGSFDATFNPGANGEVDGVMLQADGKVLVNGYFTQLGGAARHTVGRLDNPDAPTQLLQATSSSVTWLRGGSSPEVWATTFEVSSNGVDWTSLGSGQRIAGGWKLAGFMIPAGQLIRARGHVFGSGYYAASYLVETLTTSIPYVPVDPANLVNNGSFETGFYDADPNSQWMSLFPGDKALTGWDIGVSDLDWHDPVQFNVAQEGYFCMDLNGSGTIEQTIATLQPGTYEVSFWMIAPATKTGGTLNWSSVTARVELGDVQTEFTKATHYFEESTNHWQHYTFLAEVTQPASLLRISSVGDAGLWGPVIDNISVRYVGIQVTPPANRSAFEGDTVTLGVATTSPLPVSFQWQKDSVDLAEDARISGVTTPTLTVSDITAADAGAYRVRVWNDAMETHSASGSLWVVTNVVFADPNLEQAVRDDLEIPTAPLTPADLAGLISLDASGRGITSLAGLSAAANLVNLDLSSNPALQNFTPLTYLAALENLAVNDAGLDNLNWATRLTSLTALQVNANFIEDLAPLRTLTNLVSFSVTENQLTQIDPLLDLPVLTGEVNLGWNRLDTNSTSAAWSVITNLTARGATVNYDPQYAAPVRPVITQQPINLAAQAGDNINFQVAATGSGSGLLYRWEKNGVNFYDANRISGTDSETLSLDDVQPGDAGQYRVRVWDENGVIYSRTVTLWVTAEVAFADPQLEQAVRDELGIPSDPLTLADLAGMTGLNAESYGITNLSGLEAAVNLEWLILSGNPGVADFTPLFGLTRLTYLVLNQCALDNLAFVAGLPPLTELQVEDGTITDLSPLLAQRQLLRLTLSGNTAVTNFTVLSSLTNLVDVWLNGVGMADLSPLASLTHLQTLNLTDNDISDLTPLAAQSDLTWMSLYDNRVQDLAPLAGLTNLDYLDLRFNQINVNTGSAPMFVIQTLQGRGTQVEYLPQKAGATPIILSAPAWLGGGQFGFAIQSEPGSVVEIWTSTNLTSWESVGLVTNTTGSATFTAPAAATGQQFYRLESR